MGRPLKFETVGELQERIDRYFNETPRDEQTITGLAMALDTYRDVLDDYADGKYDTEDKEYSNVVKKGKQRIEKEYEIDVKKYGRSGTIFVLKNMKWKDKTEVDNNFLVKPQPILDAVSSPKVIEVEMPKETPQILEGEYKPSIEDGN